MIYCFRNKLTLKDIHNCQYVTCMNPTAGSFSISQRLQRHFATYSVMIPSEESLVRIYQAILSGHLLNHVNKFSQSVQDLCSHFVKATVQLHMRCSTVFVPTAAKFHYVFNMRDLKRVWHGMIGTTASVINTPEVLLHLWKHE